MSFNIKIPQGSFIFEGPLANLDALQALAGVYLVMHQTAKKKLRIIDIGSSDDVRQRLKHHERLYCWRNYSNDENRFFGVRYCNQQDRNLIENWLRDYYQPVCGKI